MTLRLRHLKLTLALLLLLLIAGAVFWQTTHQSSKTAPKKTAAPPAFDKAQHSITSPDSPWVIVNKTRPLPTDYEPKDLVVPKVTLRIAASAPEMQLRQPAASALEQLVKAAKAADYDLLLASGYRSASFQRGLYNRYVTQEGQASADRQSARPGYSEHQTGLAADVGKADHSCEVEECFADTPEGKWVAAHAYEYGFVIRYPKDKEATTGYIYEPWHLRYVGKSLAAEVHKTNLTLETFFKLPPAHTYSE